MISIGVSTQAEQFRVQWSFARTHAPVLTLDGSWPSIGVLDLLLAPLRGKKALSPQGDELVKGAARYLATITHECWRRFGADPTVEEGDDGVTIKTSTGPFLTSGEEVSIEIEKQLRQLLRVCPSPFPVTVGKSRLLGPDQNWLSLFALGLFLGISPYGQGPWRAYEVAQFQPAAETVLKYLAQTAVDNYSRLYHDELVGQVPELYLNDLIYPPLLIDEELPCLRAATGVVSFLRSCRFSSKALLPLAKNFARSADEVLATVGLVYYAAACREAPSPDITARAEALGVRMPVLRLPMLEVREHLNLDRDWLSADKPEESDRVRYELEKQFGFFPLIRLPARMVLDLRLRPLVRALATFDFDGAYQQLHQLLAANPHKREYRRQLIHLDIHTEQYDRAEKALNKLAVEPGFEDDPWVHNELGLLSIYRRRLDEAERCLETAHRLISPKTDRPCDIANNYAWALILLKKIPQALPIAEQALINNPSPLVPLLNLAYLHRATGDVAQFEETCLKLLDIAPADRRVIVNLLWLYAPGVFDSQ